MATFASVEETAQKLLNEFLEAGKQILIDDMDSKKRNATGKTKAAIRTANVTDKAGQLIGPEHVLYTFQGRAPGKMPPLSKIVDWCIARKIPRGAAWVIAKKIAEVGTKLYREGASQYNALIEATSQERIDKLKEDLKETYSLALESDLNELINK